MREWWRMRQERKRQHREDCELLGIDPADFYFGDNLSGPEAIKRDAANLRWRREWIGER